jgi:hypothetical protein
MREAALTPGWEGGMSPKDSQNGFADQGPRQRTGRVHEITFVWSEEEVEAIASRLENIDIEHSDDPLVTIKERIYAITGREFLLDCDGRYIV